MHPYFYRPLKQRPAPDASISDIVVMTFCVVGAVGTFDSIAAPSYHRLSSGAKDAARRAVAVRMALGSRLTAAQACTLDIMEACGGPRETRRPPGQVLPFRPRESR